MLWFHFRLDIYHFTKLTNIKKNKGRRIEKYFWTEKENLLELEISALKNSPRINFLNNILEQIPKIVHVDCARFDRNTKFLYKDELQQSILDFILEFGWRKNIPTRDSSMEASSW